MVVVRISAIYIVFIGLLEAIISFCLYSEYQWSGQVLTFFNLSIGFIWLSLALFLLNVHNIKWIFDDSGIRTEKEIYFGFFNIYNRKVAKSWNEIYFINYYKGFTIDCYDKTKKGTKYPAKVFCIFGWHNSNLKKALELAVKKLPEDKFSYLALEKLNKMGIAHAVVPKTPEPEYMTLSEAIFKINALGINLDKSVYVKEPWSPNSACVVDFMPDDVGKSDSAIKINAAYFMEAADIKEFIDDFKDNPSKEEIVKRVLEYAKDDE